MAVVVVEAEESAEAFDIARSKIMNVGNLIVQSEIRSESHTWRSTLPCEIVASSESARSMFAGYWATLCTRNLF